MEFLLFDGRMPVEEGFGNAGTPEFEVPRAVSRVVIGHFLRLVGKWEEWVEADE